jgi:hypothetical protein
MGEIHTVKCRGLGKPQGFCTLGTMGKGMGCKVLTQAKPQTHEGLPMGNCDL